MTAIQNAINAAPAGSGIYFPAGTYLVGSWDGMRLNSRSSLTLRGDGSTSILKRTGGTTPIQNRLATLAGCTGIVIEDLAFDFNGVERYGGLAISNSSQITVRRCTAGDTRLQPTWQNYDHYWLLVQGCQDVWVSDCRAEDVEMIEANNNRGVHILNNVSLRAAGTCAITWTAVQNGYYAYDYEIVGNRIIDPRKEAIVITQDPNGAYNNTVKRVRIAYNTISHETIAGTGRAIRVGYFTGGTSSGNVYEDVVVENNEIRSNPGIVRSTPEIWFMTTQSGVVFRRCHVRYNKLTGSPTIGNHAIELRHLGDSQVTDNVVTNVYVGIILNYCGSVTLTRNQAWASKYAYQIANSSGYNQIYGNTILSGSVGTWNVSGLTSTDVFTP